MAPTTVEPPQMQTLIQTREGRLSWAAKPIPSVPGGWAKVRVRAAGLSQDDLPIGPAETLGQEVAGVVQGGQQDGRAVFVDPIIACRRCSFCTSGRTNLCPDSQMLGETEIGGGFADLVVVPRWSLVEVPPSISFAQAAILPVMARGWHAARLSRRALPQGRRALVIGDSALALATALGLKAQGLDDPVLGGVRPHRLSALQDQSRFEVWAQGHAHRSSFDIVIDCTGQKAAMDLACAFIASGGVLTSAGSHSSDARVPLSAIARREVTVLTVFGATAQDVRDTAQAAYANRLGALDWFERRDMDEVTNSANDLATGGHAAPQVIFVR